MKDVLVTGGSGFIGSELIRYLIYDNRVDNVFVLVRPKDGLSGADRFEKVIAYWRRFGIIDDMHRVKIRVIEALGLVILPELRNVSIVYHCAAITEFDQPLSQCRKVNLFMTQEILAWTRKLEYFQRFVHFSTAFVVGKERGVLTESTTQTNKSVRFNNTYEQTKYESEHAVQWSGLPWTILRPSIVVGDSVHGYVYRMRVLYSAWRILLTGHLPRVPLDRKARVDIVPVDYVVRAAIALSSEPRAEKRILHLVSGQNAVSPWEILRTAHNVFGLPMPPISPPIVARILVMRWIQRFLPHELRQIVDRMRWHLPYLGTRGRIFDTTATEQLLEGSGIAVPKFADYGVKLFEFCRKSNWGKVGYVFDRS